MLDSLILPGTVTSSLEGNFGVHAAASAKGTCPFNGGKRNPDASGADGAAVNSAFRQERYHMPFDEMDQDLDFEAGAGHARVNVTTG